MNQKRIVLAGGSGFIGRALAAALVARGYEVVILTRSPRERDDGVTEIAWDGKSPGAWVKSLDGADAVVNLAGRGINCRHTPENLREIIESRVNSVQAISAALQQTARPPRVWVQSSAIGFYGDCADKIFDENSPAGNDSLAEICQQWEGAFNTANVPTTRKAVLRIGFVLGNDGGALPVLAGLTKSFLGGAVGNGRQYISWIHLADLVQMFVAAIERNELTGVFNGTAPNPAMNKDFMRELRRVLHRPWSPPAPEWAVKIGSRLMGSEASLALASQRCLPKRFLEAGFKFQFSELHAALENIYP
jgi:uncharacterized protein (TIGR01777 family)